ncbi:MAG: YfhO family protein [Clostridiales bacterium]|nr:YfhO family protein [Clostridiales bacterium]
MRLLNKKKIRFDLHLILAFVLPVVIMALAFAAAQIKPGSILPEEATLRYSEMDDDILCSVDGQISSWLTVRESFASQDKLEGMEGVELLITEYMDPFFILSLGLPVSWLQVFYMACYFLRFGLAGITMFLLLDRCIKGERSFSLFMAVLYSVSAVAMLSAGSVSLMNLYILFPLFLRYMDALITGGSFVSARYILVSMLVYISGVTGLIQGWIMTILFGVFISVLRYGKFTAVFNSLSRIVINSFVGVILTGIVNIPRLMSISYESITPEIFEEGEMRYTFFDLVSSVASGRSVDSSDVLVPAVYIGIFTVMLVILLFLNRYVPVRIKAAVAVLTVIIYVTCSYTAISDVLSFTGISTACQAARLGGLTVILFVCAGVSLKNISGLSKGSIYASILFMIAVVCIANNSENIYGYMNYQLFMTVISAIVSGVFLLSYLEGAKSSYMTAFFAAAFIALIMNCGYVFMMSDVSPEDYECVTYESGTGDLLSMPSRIPVLGDRASYVVVSSDAFTPEDGDDPALAVNKIAKCIQIDEVFSGYDTEEIINNGFESEDGRYVLKEDESEMILGIDVDDGEDIYVSSGLNVPITMAEMRFSLYDEPDDHFFHGPFLECISYDGNTFEVQLLGGKSGGKSGRIGVYTLNSHELGKLKMVTRQLGSGRFTVSSDMAGDNKGSKTLITGIPYNDNIKVKVNGRNVDTADYLNRVIADIGDVGSAPVVEITAELPGIFAGTVLSLAGLAVFVWIAFHNLREGEENVSHA